MAARSSCYDATVPKIARIEVVGVTRLFGATAALRGVSCSFDAGTITFVQGANGAGKSTLLSIIGTTLRATSGHVSYPPFGRSLRAARERLGWVAHESHCYPELTGRENVTLAAQLYGVGDAGAVEAMAERVEAGAFFDRPVRTLSRGQRQRVSLARALVHQPDIVLLDEPLSGLDAASSTRFREVVQEESRRGAIVVIVSHRDDWVSRFEARKLRLERGRLVASPTPHPAPP